MKNNKILYIVLGTILLTLIFSSVYVNFMAKSASVVSYILLIQIMVGIISAVATLFLCVGKKNHQVLLIAFLQILFTICLVTLNTVYGYNNLINASNYSEFMEYVSMNMNVYLFVVFELIMGIFTLDQFIKYRNKLLHI